MPKQTPFNLFVYGTLTNPSVFRAVLGRRIVHLSAEADGVESFWARGAVLDAYTKISPDSTYLYAVPDPHGRIRGLVVGPLPGEAMRALSAYEGRNYSRRKVKVQTAEGPLEAVAFVANLKQFEHAFGYEFRDPLKQEILLHEKIEAALKETEEAELHTTERLSRRAVSELHALTIRDLVRRHFEAGGISDYAIRQSIRGTPLRDYARVLKDAEAAALAPNYLTMVVRQVIFNQLEKRIHEDFRYELDHLPAAGKYYERTVSSLAALRTINGANELTSLLAADCLADLDFATSHLVDYVRWSIVAADTIYDQQAAKQHVRFILSHMHRGYIPLGAELEFSNIGHDVIRDPGGQVLRDRDYDGFLYFKDFGLDVLTWKLGGHIDDHHLKTSSAPRRGFFETALGSLSIEANLSKPVTDDPWLLNHFIHEARRFYLIAPHSVHISLQLRSQNRPVRDRVLPLSILKCLFAIGGDLTAQDDDTYRIERLVSQEITGTDGAKPVASANPSAASGPDGQMHMLFSEITRRHSHEEPDPHAGVHPAQSGRYVQQFKFLRLKPELNYEPIAMALKGIQLALLPGTFMTRQQYQQSAKHRRLFDAVMAWGAKPTALSAGEIEEFLEAVYEGLRHERRGKCAHDEAYISWSLSELRDMLRDFNRRLTETTSPGENRPSEGL